MSKPTDQVAQDIAAITKLKAKYWHCIDNKLWDEVVRCFAEDAVADYPNGKFRGSKAIAKSLRDTLGHGPVAHVGHNLGIEITSDTTATATWQADVSMSDAKTNVVLKLRTYYEDDYVKDKGHWMIKSAKMRIMPTDPDLK